jgi:hypothetical protein
MCLLLRADTTGLKIADLWRAADSKGIRHDLNPLSFSCRFDCALAGIAANTVPTIVEQDSWDYHTTRYNSTVVGKSMVCCVFVCNSKAASASVFQLHTLALRSYCATVWKAGGLFQGINNQINCGGERAFSTARCFVSCAHRVVGVPRAVTEQTNYDDYSMLMFDTSSARPQVCQNADPNNKLCQVQCLCLPRLRFLGGCAHRSCSCCCCAARGQVHGMLHLAF